MFLERLREFFTDVGTILKKVVTSRVIPFAIIAIALFALLIYRLFVLQIVNGGTYTKDYTLKMQRTITTTGTRGNIYDSQGKLLAYSELSYNVVISDSGFYSNKKQRNQILNDVISNTIDIIEKYGDTVDFDFHIRLNSEGEYAYDVEDNALLRFLRDVYGHSSISQLKDEERNATAEETVEYLANYYGLDTSLHTPYKNLEILYIRYNMSSNLYQRYITFTIASNVSQKTMASILENEATLNGVEIEEGSIRHYNYSVCLAHILGYTGKVSESELEELKLIDDSYESNDIVGKSGIESVYEVELSGTKGYKTVMVDNVGRVLSVEEEVESSRGSDIYLTIDADYQQELYNLLERRLAEVLYTNMVPDDSTYRESAGMITIPVVDVYNALINNGLIDMDLIASSTTDAATVTYNTFSARKETVLNEINYELNNGTAYKYLSKGMKEYMKEIRSLLISNNIINSEKIDATNDLSEKWSDGTISLHQYLEGAIHNEWINIYNLDVPSDYPSYDEVLCAIINEAMREISQDREFDKLIYEELIKGKKISGKNICLILMEQKAIPFTESEYVSIRNGGSTYNFLRNKIINLDITPAQLALDPCSGSCVVEDPTTGRLLAMVTYPSYDTNYFSGTIDAEYYASLLADKSSPLLNRCTQTKLAPGSTFKPCIAIAGLNEGVINTRTIVECTGIFEKVTPNIKCYIYPNNHGNVDIYTALGVSCNCYFCEVGYRLSCMQSGILNHDNGLAVIAKYADILGLSTKTGIQLPESSPHVSDYNSVVSSIGQGTHAYSSLNLARYVSTISNRGTVYDSSIVLKSVESDGTEHEVEPVIYKQTEIPNYIWDTVQVGMENAANAYFRDLKKRLPVSIYCKSGTAQEDKTRGNHAVYITYTRDAYGNPGIVASCFLPYAYAATNAGIMNYYALSTYYNIDIPKAMYFNDYSIIVEE